MTTNKNSKRKQQGFTQGEELRIIKQMIEKTKADTAESGTNFIMSGWLVFAAALMTYMVVYLELAQWAWVPWAVLMPIGVIISAVSGVRQVKKVKVVSYTDQALSSLWQACGLSFVIVGFVAIPLKAISIQSLVPLIAIIAGIGTFATGGIIDWKLVRWGGVAWCIAAVIMMMSHWHYHTLILAVTIFPGYLVPGYALRREYRKV